MRFGGVAGNIAVSQHDFSGAKQDFRITRAGLKMRTIEPRPWRLIGATIVPRLIWAITRQTRLAIAFKRHVEQFPPVFHCARAANPPRATSLLERSRACHRDRNRRSAPARRRRLFVFSILSKNVTVGLSCDLRR